MARDPSEFANRWSESRIRQQKCIVLYSFVLTAKGFTDGVGSAATATDES